jgi:hypothetical protein
MQGYAVKTHTYTLVLDSVAVVKSSGSIAGQFKIDNRERCEFGN